MPTSGKVKRELLASLPLNLEGKIYELGAGWGTLAFPLARKYPNCQILAYENSLVPYLFCRLSLWWYPHSNLIFLKKDFFSSDLKEASLVICYLFPGVMGRLREKFKVELPQRALIVTHTFALPDWIPSRVIVVGDLYHSKIYHYRGQDEC